MTTPRQPGRTSIRTRCRSTASGTTWPKSAATSASSAQRIARPPTPPNRGRTSGISCNPPTGGPRYTSPARAAHGPQRRRFRGKPPVTEGQWSPPRHAQCPSRSHASRHRPLALAALRGSRLRQCVDARRAGPTWPQFLRSQADATLACDFFTADLLDGTQAHVLAVIEHATRRIRILGVTLHPTGEWTTQQARNLIMDLGGQAEQMKFMIRDRGPDFTAAFDAVLADAGILTVLCNVRTPRMNAIAERWTGGCRRELLDRTLIWNQHHLLRILREYESHHNQHRPHRSLHGAAPLKPLPEPVDLEQYRIRRQARVGGLINEYRLVA